MITSHSAAEGCISMKQPGRHYRRSRLSGQQMSVDWGAMLRATALLAFTHWRGIRRRPLDAHSRVGRGVVLRGWVTSLLVGLLAGFWTAPVWAKAYGNYDIRQLLVPSPTPGAGGSLNLAFLDGVLADLSAHAASYPPQFDSPADMQRAHKDARNLIGMLNVAFGAAPPAGLLFRMALLGSFGHNLDVPDAAAFAQNHFRRLLSTDTEHAMGNFHYGAFLAGIGRPKEALPYLNKARDKGVIPALYSLGMAQLTLGDKAAALVSLNEYSKRSPADQKVKVLVDAIRDGKVEMQTEAKK